MFLLVVAKIAHLNKKNTCENKKNCSKNIHEIFESLFKTKNIEYICNGCEELFKSETIFSNHKDICKAYKLFIKLEEKDEENRNLKNLIQKYNIENQMNF